MRGIFLAWIVWANITVLVTAQAPGDEDELCTVTLPNIGQNVITYSPNIKPLMDSFHYEDLLPPPSVNNIDPTWQRVDVDGNDNIEMTTTWTEQGGEVCRTIVTVCGFNAGIQNNWLITQFINRTVNGVRLPQVVILFEYQLTDCPMGGACQRTFVLHKYERSSVNKTAAIETDRYQFVNRLTTRDSGVTTNVTENINFDTDNSGFYLGVQDESTCILIHRLLVYYHVCPGEISNLVMRPETIAPSIGNSMQLQVTANCIANARPRDGVSAKLTCSGRGVWFQQTVTGCVCEDGYIESNDGSACLSCDAGTYAKVSDGTCAECPANSNSTVQGLAMCPCVEGFYRLPTEIDLPCTQPPSAPTNVTVLDVNETTITLSWGKPVFKGGRIELFYSLWYLRSGQTERILFGTVETTMGVITGLLAGTTYDVFVTAENNITDQVPQNLFNERALATTLTTVPQDDQTTVIAGAVAAVVTASILMLVLFIILLMICLIRQKSVAKRNYALYQQQNQIELPRTGQRMYVDPTTYTSPNQAVEEFATEIPPKNLRMQEEIGAGEFGTVYKGTWKSEGKNVAIAVKTLKPGSSHRQRNDFLTEASIMGQFNHPNVIKLYGVVTKIEPAMIVMEFMTNGSLYSYLRRNDERLSVLNQVKMTRGVAAGMDYLSTVGFVHRDLAARNVLVSNVEICKVADFGLSRETVDDEYDVKKGGKIPVRWTAPEAIFRRKFTSSSDVWSFGVLVWEIMSYAQHPYEAHDWDNQTVLDQLEAGYRLECPKDCPQSVYDIMLECWNSDLTKRPPFSSIVQRLDHLLETNMAPIVSPNRAFKKAPKTYLSTATLINPLDYSSVEEWLKAIKMERYNDKFEKEGFIDINQIVQLSEANLRDMGITLSGHLFRITTSIEKAHAQIERQPSVKV